MGAGPPRLLSMTNRVDKRPGKPPAEASAFKFGESGFQGAIFGMV
jgi:hypothetical protein